MWDVTALDGPGLAAAWPAFAAHARDALSAVPVPDAATRLLIHRAAGPRYRPNRWGPPVDAEPDPHLLRVGQAMAAVAGLLTQHVAPRTSMEAGHDADLTRQRALPSACSSVRMLPPWGCASTMPDFSRRAPGSLLSSPRLGWR
jgi:hypothetical protein